MSQIDRLRRRHHGGEVMMPYVDAKLWCMDARPTSVMMSRMLRCTVMPLAWLAGLSVAMSPDVSQAQNIQSYFPAGTAGYDRELGVTVLTRQRPLYESPSLQIGSFEVNSGLDQALFYNSNVNASPGSGSWGSRTAGSAFAASNWTRNSLAASVGFTHNQFFSLPGESYTDWNVGLGGGYTIGDGAVQAAYSHQTYHQIGVNIGAITSETPVLDQIDSATLNYTANFARFSVTPSISYSAYRFGTATVGGVSLNEEFLNRDVVAGGVVTRYSMSEEGTLLLVMRGLGSNFVHSTVGQPKQDSQTAQILGGIDYQSKGVWRYRLLVGVETRMFDAAQFPSHTGLISEGSVIWTPTELTTLTGAVSRGIEDPETPGTNGFTLTEGSLKVDHELKRNVFLQARGAIRYAQFLQGGGTQTDVNFGAGVTWLVNRRVRLVLNYDQTRITGTSRSIGQTTSVFSQSVLVLNVHLSL